jgi:Transposase DDE domain
VGLFKIYLNIKTFTKSAFVQYRKKIKPDIFKGLSKVIVDEFYTDNELGVKLWNGFRLLAVDGSRLTLPNTEELKQIYGQIRNKGDIDMVQARVSVLYDVINNYIIDGLLSPIATGEGQLALKHLLHVKENDIVIYDRGYTSFSLIYEHLKQGSDFLMRSKTSFSNVTREFIKSGKSTEIVSIYPGQRTKKLIAKEYDKNASVKVRLVRVNLPSGEVELLITSLLDITEYNTNIFKELYFKRWGVESFYDELKNKLKVEYFSGYSNQIIMQDFYAALFVSNVQTLIVSELTDEINEQTKGAKYKYKVNTNLSYGFLKNRIVTLFFSENEMNETIKELKTLFKKHIIPIRPNRSSLRIIGKYSNRLKPKITKNQRDAF